MENVKGKLIVIAKKRIDVPGLMDDVLDQVLEAALVEAVAKSENKIDDILVAALYPQLEAVLKSKVREAWESIPA
jgi:hypothetical protein